RRLLFRSRPCARAEAPRFYVPARAPTSSHQTRATTSKGARMKVAAIDCGTNSIRLLIADLSPEAGGVHMRDVRREMRIVRLGQDVDRTKRFHPDALARTFEAAKEYADLIRAEGARRIRIGATSATRDATDRGEIIASIQRLLAVTPEVISGEAEARFSFIGASRV